MSYLDGYNMTAQQYLYKQQKTETVRIIKVQNGYLIYPNWAEGNSYSGALVAYTLDEVRDLLAKEFE